MCYGTCKYEKYHSGECNNPSKFSKFIDAGCNPNFICEQCNNERTEEEAGEEVGYCIYCEEQNKEDETIDNTALDIKINLER
jgi:hypothetical protein